MRRSSTTSLEQLLIRQINNLHLLFNDRKLFSLVIDRPVRSQLWSPQKRTVLQTLLPIRLRYRILLCRYIHRTASRQLNINTILNLKNKNIQATN